MLMQITKKMLPPALRSHIKFEIVSAWGRFLSRPLQVDPKRINIVNLGCGPETVQGFINIDFFGTKGADYCVDLRHLPLKIPSNSTDGIFSEHTFEHLTYENADRLLAECFRILKPGAWIRIIVPDVSILINKYHEGDTAYFREWERIFFTESSDLSRRPRKLATPLQALSFVTQEHFHVSSWDEETAAHFLAKNCFKNIQKRSFRTGTDPQLLKDSSYTDRQMISLYIEAQK